MSYISAIRTGDDVLVWERNKGIRTLETFRAPYYLYLDATIGRPDLLPFKVEGEYKSYKGLNLKRYDFTSAKDFQQMRAELQSDGISLFESDIPSEVRVLSQHYYNKPTPALNVTLVDIEVDYDTINGFSSVYNPYAPINSVALYHRWQKRYVVLCIPPNIELWGTGPAPEGFYDSIGEISPLPEDVKIEIVFCKDEKELLMYLLVEIEDTDILSGWNSEFFDIPYIGKRLELLGKKYFRQMSFDGAKLPEFREVIQNEITGQKNLTIDISGRISLDYLALFKKYEQHGRPSYKLENIGDEIVPELPKLEYEGSLADLYRKNFPHFIRYNLRDTEVLEGFERKLGYINLANEMVHMSTGLFKHVMGTIKLSELSVINECHHELGGLVVNDITRPDVDKQIKGALVLLPQKGEHNRAGSIDVKSLYPSAIIAMNISPEMLRGQFVNDEYASHEIAEGTNTLLSFVHEDDHSIEEMTADEWRTVLWERKWAVSGFGTVFDQSKMGIIPTILDKWFKQRIEYQKMMRAAKESGDKDKADYYDRLQYVFKIKLNSFYGALSNLYFRFYDLRMGESTTGTGRAVVTHQCRKTNETLTGVYDVDFPLYETIKDAMERGEYTEAEARLIALDGPKFNGKFQADAIIYGDTDSTYFETYADTHEDAIKVANLVAKKVNASYPAFMRDHFLCQPGFDNRISCSREIVTGRGIFVDKKRYILHVLDQDGKPVDKMKVMGLDTKKTTLPKEVSKKLNGFVERYLKGEDWNSVAEDIVDYKEKILTTPDIMSIGLPKGINGVENYTVQYGTDKETRLPGHVAAAIFYNLCVADQNDKKSITIRSGMKIKVFYLTHEYSRFKSIAIPVDIEEVPKWFFDNFEVDRQAHVERLVDNPLQNIIKAIGKEVPSRQSLFVDSTLVW